MRFILLLISALGAAPAVARPHYHSAAPVAYLIDISSGAVLYEKAGKKRIPPASMTKMMTVYVAFDLIDRGKLKLDDKFTVRHDTWSKWNSRGSSMFLKPGEQVTVADLLHGIVTVSGNDAAVTLAEGISRDEASFVKRMNATARRLNMTGSMFWTANGWPDQGRTLTTARDMALLGTRTVEDFPGLYRQFYGRRSFRWNGIDQPNRNPILGHVAGADGVKTGHTDEAGYCFTGTAEQNGRRLLMVVAGLPNMAARAEESRKLLEWGFKEWRAKPLFDAGSIVAELPVQLGSKSRVSVVAPRPLALVLPAKADPRYKLVVRFSGPVKAPFSRGTELAQLIAKFDDGSEQAMPLIAARSVGTAGFVGRIWNGAKSLVGA